MTSANQEREMSGQKPHGPRRWLRLPRALWRGLVAFWRASTEEQLYHHLRKEIHKREDLFLLLCFGDLLGLPMPGYLSLRLLPYVLKDLELWRRRIARRRSRFWAAWEEFGREF